MIKKKEKCSVNSNSNKKKIQPCQFKFKQEKDTTMFCHFTAQTTHTKTVKAPLVCTRPAVTIALCYTCTTELSWRQNSTSAGHLLTKPIQSL